MLTCRTSLFGHLLQNVDYRDQNYLSPSESHFSLILDFGQKVLLVSLVLIPNTSFIDCKKSTVQNCLHVSKIILLTIISRSKRKLKVDMYRLIRQIRQNYLLLKTYRKLINIYLSLRKKRNAHAYNMFTLYSFIPENSSITNSN